MGCFSGLK